MLQRQSPVLLLEVFPRGFLLCTKLHGQSSFDVSLALACCSASIAAPDLKKASGIAKSLHQAGNGGLRSGDEYDSHKDQFSVEKHCQSANAPFRGDRFSTGGKAAG